MASDFDIPKAFDNAFSDSAQLDKVFGSIDSSNIDSTTR